MIVMRLEKVLKTIFVVLGTQIVVVIMVVVFLMFVGVILM